MGGILKSVQKITSDVMVTGMVCVVLGTTKTSRTNVLMLGNNERVEGGKRQKEAGLVLRVRAATWQFRETSGNVLIVGMLVMKRRTFAR